MMQALICRFQVVGVHRFADATDPFERELHRHVFHFEVVLNSHGLSDDLPQLTPVRLKQLCLDAFQPLARESAGTGVFNFDDMSALGIADWLATAMQYQFEGRGVRVTVLEDDENGAVVSLGHYEQ